MKLKYEFEIVDMGDEIIAVPVGEGSRNVRGVLKLNQEGVEILQLLREDVSEETIINVLATKYENEKQLLCGYVRRVIETLADKGLIESS